MARRRATVCLFLGGSTFFGEEGFSYDVRTPRTCVRVNHDVTYSEMLDCVCNALQLDRNSCHLKMTCRFPSVLGPQITKYMPLEIVDNNTVEAMVGAIFESEQIRSIDLYVEIENWNQGWGTSQVAGPFTRLLTQDYGNVSQNISMIEEFLPHQSNMSNSPNNDATQQLHAMPNRETVVQEVAMTDDSSWAYRGVDVNLSPHNSVEEAEEEEERMMDELGEDDEEDEEAVLGQASDGMHAESRMHEPMSPFFSTVELSNQTLDSSSSLHGHVWDPMRDELSKGLIFADKDQLRNAIQMYSIRTHQQYEVVETNSKIWSLRCKLHDECGCQWRMRACKRKKHGWFEITKLEGPHTCLYPAVNRDHRQLNSILIGAEIQGLVKADPSLKIAVIRDYVQQKFNYQVSYKKAWMAKQKAVARVFGDWESSYNFLPKFMGALKKYNDGTIVKWQTFHTSSVDSVILHKIFWAFKPSIEGFSHCRPVVSIDATFLYGRYKGKLLIAMGADGNNQIFPLAFAVVDEESYSSWSWFLEHLKDYVIRDREGICLISDRHNGILAAVNAPNSRWKPPHAYHRFCLRHVQSNFNSRFKNAHLKKLVWIAGSTHQIRKFDRVMEEIGKLNKDAREYLMNIPADQWSIAHDDGRRYGMRTTNISEVFNGVLKGARNLPITACVELIFERVVYYFNVRRVLASDGVNNNYTYTLYAAARITRNQEKAGRHKLTPYNSGLGIMRVLTAKGNAQVVNLHTSTCSCGKWNIYKMPCSHAIAVMADLRVSFHQFVDECYSIGAYERTWQSQFFPLYHEDYWDTPSGPRVCHNPVLLRRRGRPRSSRLRNEMDIREVATHNHCGICRQTGHDRRSCPTRNHPQAGIGPSN